MPHGFRPEHVQHSRIIERDRLAEGVPDSSGDRYRFDSVTLRVIAVSAMPCEMRKIGAAKHAKVGPGEQS